jgi:formate-dependent nitrite reductase membrane component NrfD
MADTTRETPQAGNGHVETSHHPRTDPEREGRDYYGIPPIKEHTWTWEVPVYFWLGGLGAGAHLISTVAQLLGWKDKAFFRATRYTVLVTMILSPILLIMDLGRPERFYNMLRIVKLRSPMSTGSWALAIFGVLSGLIAAAQAARDGLLGRDNILVRLVKTFIPDRLLSVVALPVGLYVGLYSGILLSATSVPMWARNFLLMGPTFLSSGLSTGLSAISFILHLGDWGERRTLEALRRTERITLLIEGGLLAASLARMGRWGKPLYSKKLAPLFLGGALLGGILAPFALLSGRETRGKSLLTSVLALLGGLALRFAMIEGGRLSARDPQATFTFAKRENLPMSEEEVQRQAGS